MVPLRHMINCVLSSCDHIVLDAAGRAKSGKVPDTFPSIMQRLSLSMFALIACVILSSCYRVSLKDEVFSTKPIWESSKLAALSKAECTKTAGMDTQVKTVRIEDVPGLAMLVRQVFDRDVGAPSQKDLLKATSNGTTYDLEFNGLHITRENTPDVMAYGEQRFVAADDQPLHPKVAALDVTRAIVRSMEVSYLRGNCINSEDLEDMKLSRSDFEDFARQMVKTTLGLDHESPPNGQDRIKKVALAESNKKITLDGLLLAYLTAYYNGKFVDRTGGTSQKAKLDLTITNETITAFLHVAIEALFDYAIAGSKKLRVPVVYKGKEDDDNPTFINSSGKTPTLATYISKLKGSQKPYMKYVIEPAKKNNEIGISTEKLGYIRYASGLAADSSQALSGAIVRLLGGANLGFGIMGKLSFGDNETLSKVADTIVEGASRRITEAFASHVLYGIKIPQGTSVPEFLATK